jgi:alpha-galactosidase
VLWFLSVQFAQAVSPTAAEIAEAQDWIAARFEAGRESKDVEPYLLGDYYPLMPYSLEKTAWIGRQFDEPELGGGFVQAFRREEAKEDSLVLKLQGLEPNAAYAIENMDNGKIENLSGKALLNAGLQVKITERPGAALSMYHVEQHEATPRRLPARHR